MTWIPSSKELPLYIIDIVNGESSESPPPPPPPPVESNDYVKFNGASHGEFPSVELYDDYTIEFDFITSSRNSYSVLLGSRTDGSFWTTMKASGNIGIRFSSSHIFNINGIYNDGLPHHVKMRYSASVIEVTVDGVVKLSSNLPAKSFDYGYVARNMAGYRFNGFIYNLSISGAVNTNDYPGGVASWSLNGAYRESWEYDANVAGKPMVIYNAQPSDVKELSA